MSLGQFLRSTPTVDFLLEGASDDGNDVVTVLEGCGYGALLASGFSELQPWAVEFRRDVSPGSSNLRHKPKDRLAGGWSFDFQAVADDHEARGIKVRS
jgi:hypothetical protein